MPQMLILALCAGPWLQEFTDLRDKINAFKLDIETIRSVVAELDIRIPKTGRNHPIPKISERALARMEREAAMAGQMPYLLVTCLSWCRNAQLALCCRKAVTLLTMALKLDATWEGNFIPCESFHAMWLDVC